MVAKMMRGSYERENVPVTVSECAIVQTICALGDRKVVLADPVLSIAELADGAARPTVRCHRKAATVAVSEGALDGMSVSGNTDHLGCGRVAAFAAAARAATRSVPVVILVVVEVALRGVVDVF